MNNLKLIGSLSFILFLALSKTFSQGNFSGHLGPSFPMSDFAIDHFGDYDDKAGGAGIGFGIGVQYVYPLTENGIGLYTGADLIINGLSSEVRDDFGRNSQAKKIPTYINFPVGVGLNYFFKSNKEISIFGNTGIALSFLKITKNKTKDNGDIYMSKFGLSNSVGFQIGGGVMFNNSLKISLNYMGLGVHDITGEYEGPYYSGNFEIKRKVDIVTLTIDVFPLIVAVKN